MYLISSVYFLLKPYHLTRIDRVAGDIVPSLLMFDANEPESKVRMCDNSLRTCFLTTIVNTSRNSGNSHSNPSLGSSRNKIEQVVWRTQTTTTVMTWSLPLKFVHCSYFDHKMYRALRDDKSNNCVTLTENNSRIPSRDKVQERSNHRKDNQNTTMNHTLKNAARWVQLLLK